MNKWLLGLGVGGTTVIGYGLEQKSRALSGLEEPPYRLQGSLVSVVTPTLEEEDYLGLLLQSVYGQTYSPLEVVVADQSPPESKQLAREILNQWSPYLNVRMVDVPVKNVSTGRNVGVAASRGNPVLIIDADCIMESAYVEKLLADLENGAVLAHGIDCWYDNDLSNSLKSLFSWVKPRLHTTGRGVMIRREDFERVGGYREDFDPLLGLHEDVDFGERVEQMFGEGAVWLNKGAVVGESLRRPLSMGTGPGWTERGWRNGRVIE